MSFKDMLLSLLKLGLPHVFSVSSSSASETCTLLSSHTGFLSFEAASGSCRVAAQPSLGVS